MLRATSIFVLLLLSPNDANCAPDKTSYEGVYWTLHDPEAHSPEALNALQDLPDDSFWRLEVELRYLCEGYTVSADYGIFHASIDEAGAQLNRTVYVGPYNSVATQTDFIAATGHGVVHDDLLITESGLRPSDLGHLLSHGPSKTIVGSNGPRPPERGINVEQLNSDEANLLSFTFNGTATGSPNEGERAEGCELIGRGRFITVEAYPAEGVVYQLYLNVAP